MDTVIHIWMVMLLLLACSIAGCITETKAPPPESIPGPSIIDIEDIASNSTGLSFNDAIGRQVTVPRSVNHVLCSGDGCMRYLTYLQATDMAVGSDQYEKSVSDQSAVPYILAHPELKNLTKSGDPSGKDNIQLISQIQPKPDVIIRMNTAGGIDPDILQKGTEIPVIVLNPGDLIYGRNDMNYALRVMGAMLNRTERAEDVIRFFDKVSDNLDGRTRNIPDFQKKKAYIGGYSPGESKGLLSTDPSYEPFRLSSVHNVVEGYVMNGSDQDENEISGNDLSRASPDAIFIDLATINPSGKNAVSEIEYGTAFQELPSVKSKEIYGVLPTEKYGNDHESILANAYFIGKTLYPEKFTDVDPKVLADYIFSYLDGKPMFEEINKKYNGMALTHIPLF